MTPTFKWFDTVQIFSSEIHYERLQNVTSAVPLPPAPEGWGKVIFSLCVLVHTSTREGGSPSQVWMGGVPHPSSGWGLCTHPPPPPERACHRPDMLWSVCLLHFTHPVLTGKEVGTSSSSWWEVPPSSPTGEGVPSSTPWWGTLHQGLHWSTLPIRDWMRVCPPPHRGLDGGLPPPPRKSKPQTGYAAVGTPLAFHAVGLFLYYKHSLLTNRQIWAQVSQWPLSYQALFRRKEQNNIVNKYLCTRRPCFASAT